MFTFWIFKTGVELADQTVILFGQIKRWWYFFFKFLSSFPNKIYETVTLALSLTAPSNRPLLSAVSWRAQCEQSSSNRWSSFDLFIHLNTLCTIVHQIDQTGDQVLRTDLYIGQLPWLPGLCMCTICTIYTMCTICTICTICHCAVYNLLPKTPAAFGSVILSHFEMQIPFWIMLLSHIVLVLKSPQVTNKSSVIPFWKSHCLSIERYRYWMISTPLNIIGL